MKKYILIILAISLYSVFLIFLGDSISRITIAKSGAFFNTDYKGAYGFKCIIDYKDKISKENLFVGFDKNTSKSCPEKPKVIEITQQEAMQIFQERLDDKQNSKIIIPADNSI